MISTVPLPVNGNLFEQVFEFHGHQCLSGCPRTTSVRSCFGGIPAFRTDIKKFKRFTNNIEDKQENIMAYQVPSFENLEVFHIELSNH